MQKIIFIIRITNNVWWNFQSHLSINFCSRFNLLSCELDNFRFKVLYWVILYWHYIKQNTLTVPCEEFKIVSFTSSQMKNINLLLLSRRFPVKLIPSKHLLIFKTSWRRLQYVFSVIIFRLPRCLEDVLQRRLEDISRDVLKTSWKTKNCYAEDVFKTILQDILKTCVEDVLKTCLDVLETNKIFTGDICT